MLLSFISSIANYLWFGLSIYFGFVLLFMFIKGLLGDKDHKDNKGLLFLCVLLCTGIALWSGSAILEDFGSEDIESYEYYESQSGSSNVSFKGKRYCTHALCDCTHYVSNGEGYGKCKCGHYDYVHK